MLRLLLSGQCLGARGRGLPGEGILHGGNPGRRTLAGRNYLGGREGLCVERGLFGDLAWRRDPPGDAGGWSSHAAAVILAWLSIWAPLPVPVLLSWRVT